MGRNESLRMLGRITVIAVALAWSVAASGKVIYVDTDADGLNDGTSWENANNYLQDGLADANASDKPVEVRVAQGVYRPDQGGGCTLGDRSASFVLGTGVTIAGGYAGSSGPDPNARDRLLFRTDLSGDLAGNDVDVNDLWGALRDATRIDNSQNLIVCDSADGTAVLDGLTITAGRLDAHSDHGGIIGGSGMLNYQSSPTIRNCVFKGNAVAGTGGAILNVDSSPTIINCTFTENVAGYGGAIGAAGGSPILRECTFVGNQAGIAAGAVHTTGSDPSILNCAFIRNSATESGGALRLDSGTFGLYNCLLVENSANWGGGMSCIHDANAVIRNCTFSFNTSAHGHSLVSNSYEGLRPSDIEIVNCIFWGNEEGDGSGPRGPRGAVTLDDTSYAKEIWNEDGSRIAIRFSDLRGGADAVLEGYGQLVWGAGNIDADPLFAEPNQCDYHLKSQAGRWDVITGQWTTDEVTSPCIDAGDPMSPIGLETFPNGGVINMGAYGGTSQASKSYFDKPSCEIIVAGDINGDCEVNFLDFRLMALHWCENNNEVLPR